MALPPEPLASLLQRAEAVVEAYVSEIIANGSAAPKLSTPPGWTGGGQRVGAQTVRLRVVRVLKGTQDVKEIVAVKPEGAYGLRVGNRGPFLLDGSEVPVILGRHGPDTWPLAAWPDVPTRVIAGRHDRLFPLSFMQAVSRDRLGVEPEIVDSGHLPALSVPGALAARLTSPG